MKIIYCDSLVIGGGLAGLRAAIAAREPGVAAGVRRSMSGRDRGSKIVHKDCINC